MSAFRRIVVPLVATLSLVGAPATALAQGAGDEQYSDPLAGSTQTTQSSGSSGSSGSGSSSTETSPLTQSPPVTGSGSTTTGTATGTTAGQGTAATSSAGTQLPNTGADPRVLALLGLALLLAGAGLRLRTRDARY